MEKDEFESVFDRVVADRLLDAGFFARGKSFFRGEGMCQFAWCRGGGRLSLPGTIAHVIAFRHSFLRRFDDGDSGKPPRYAEYYPWVFDAESLPASESPEWVFNPDRLMRLPFGRYSFEHRNCDGVSSDLGARVERFLEGYVPWCESLDISSAMEQFRPFESEWAVARTAIEDYEARAQQENGPSGLSG